MEVNAPSNHHPGWGGCQHQEITQDGTINPIMLASQNSELALLLQAAELEIHPDHNDGNHDTEAEEGKTEALG